MIRSGSGHVHLAGACGVGMAGLALLLKARGLKVSGCDVAVSPIAGWLAGKGIKVASGHAPSHLTRDVRWVIRSSAVPVDAPEMQAAMRRKLPVFMRGETLAAILEGAESVAVAGTHGKTTTTGLATQILRACGRSPSFCIGGEVPSLGGVAGIGRGKALVVEADESDGTLSLYEPDYAVITNIEPDHMEHFGSMDGLRRCFGDLVKGAHRKVIYCADDPGAASLCDGWIKGVSYGLSKEASVRGTRMVLRQESSSFDVERNGVRLGKVGLPLPGRHNVANALAAIAVVLEMGIEFDRIRRALAKVELPRRRFEKAVCRRDLLVISDYGHHPSEIRALVVAATRLARSRRGTGGHRMRAAFQPHRYSRTLALGPHFPDAFSGVDEVVLVPVYEASEKVVSGGTIYDLYATWRNTISGARGNRRKTGATGATAAPPADSPWDLPSLTGRSAPPVLLAGSLEQAWQYFRRTRLKGDTLLVVGAGDVEKIAGWAKDECDGGQTAAHRADRSCVRGIGLKSTVVRYDEPLSRRTTFKVGGTADIWMDIGSVGDLRKIVRTAARRKMPFRLVGGGSNILAADLGVRGICARLTGAGFKGIKATGSLVVAGAGVPLAGLLAWTEANRRAGLEFLEGIPGTVGGALRMNAGAWGGEIGRHIVWIRFMDDHGAIRLLRKPKFAYRQGISCRCIMEAAFKLRVGNPAVSRKVRSGIADKRAWMKGLHCAGSVFKNPPGDSAGRLIEKAGLKGMTVGGATISPKHANVIVAAKGASASDVIALAGKTRTEVKLRFGVELETELEILQ